MEESKNTSENKEFDIRDNFQILLFSVGLSILAMIFLSMPFYRVRNVEKQPVDNNKG